MTAERTTAATTSAGARGGFVSVFFAPELKWVYRAFVIFLAIVGSALAAIGAGRLLRYYYTLPQFRDETGLSSGIGYSALGVLLLLLLLGVNQVRRYFSRQASELDVAPPGRLREGDFEEYDRVRRLREEKDELDFQRNLRSIIVVERLAAQSVVLFPNVEWSLQPGINVLLGRNGYGKSLILRALVGLLQRDEQSTNLFFPEGRDTGAGKLALGLRCNDETGLIERNSVRFAEAIGKVPLLAIPDSRFLDRSQLTVGPVESDTTDLRRNGAHHFLQQLPFGSVIQALLHELCLDYWEHGRSFKLPVFEFLVDCVRRLTDSDFRFHSIERQGRTGFAITVISEGNATPVPIQLASQGTLSVLAMFGLIRSFLAATSGLGREVGAKEATGIVVIDEADAHLHPVWQQRVPTVLKDLFPRVQFVLSAHSPLFVAGCWRQEVAVLRRNPPTSPDGGFFLEQLDRDFVGATAAELYSQIFEVEELDATYLEYATKATLRSDHAKRINKLREQEDSGPLRADDARELEHLYEETRRIRRAVTITEQRHEESDKDARIAELESENLRLRSQLSASTGEVSV